MPSSDVYVTPTITARDYFLIYNGGDATISAEDKIVVEDIITYKKGQTISFTITSPDENYELQDIDLFKTGDETDKINILQADGVYTFTMPEHDVTLSPIWNIVAYNITKPSNMTLSVSEGGVVTINENQYYKEGATVTVTVTPPSGRIISGFSVNNDFKDGTAVPFTDNDNGTYMFTMPNGDVTLSAAYDVNTTHMKLLTGPDAVTVTGGDDTYARPSAGYGCLLDGKYSSEKKENYSKWCVGEFKTGGHYNSTNPCYIEFNTAGPVIPRFYTLITGNDNKQYPGRNPKNWKVMAKLSENDEWTTIATVTNDNVLQDENYTTFLFDFDDSENAYQYFRFEITANKGNDFMQLSEMQMWVKDRVVLADNVDNYAIVYNNENSTNEVILSGRTLWKDNSWNTLCLPFSLTEEQIAASPIAGADIRELNTASFDNSNGTLKLDFTGKDEVKSITAGTPYIIKWEGDGSENIVSPVFNDVTISATMNDKVIIFDDTEGATKGIIFMGTYSPITYTEADKSILFLGASNTMYYPQPDKTDPDNPKYPVIGAQRAFFMLYGITAGEPTETAGGINNFVLNFDGEGTNSIENGDGAWYDLSGRKLSGKPKAKGIYINNGHK